jgi:hypothetical protein
MQNKPVLMIHEFDKKFLKLDLQNYILTFDDGLFSQFFYHEEILKIPTEKIFFISTGIVCENEQSLNFPTCSEAHKKAFNENKEDYMTKEQIAFLLNQKNVKIGGHSHSHTNLNNFKSLSEKVKHIENDTKNMLNWFEKNLNYKPEVFCFPYNENLNGFYDGLLKKYNFKNFFGKERINITSI